MTAADCLAAPPAEESDLMIVSPDSALVLLGQISADHPGWHLGWAVVVSVLAASAVAAAGAAGVGYRRGSVIRTHAELKRFQVNRRDGLTELASRRSFIDGLATRLLGAAPSALLLIDLDGFAELNAKHGQRVGDEVLAAMGTRLRTLFPGQAHAARLGDDEFAVVVPVPGGLNDAEVAVLGVIRALMAPVDCAAGTLECRVSVGVALLPEHGKDTDAALLAAGQALRSVKATGAPGWRFFDPDENEQAQRRTGLKDELRAAIAEHSILPHYQPIVDLHDGRIAGFEVLARWQHSKRGLLPPDLFIPLAEEMGLTGQITQQLMRRVIADSRGWPNWLYFAFNVSPGQLRELISMLRTPPDWPEGMMDPRRLEVEVTESALIEDVDVAREVISLLQLRGTRVVLDDFGIGYSNFFHLRELPFDRIKIDRSFVMDVNTDTRAEACMRAMLALAGELRIPIVAEGVQDEKTEAAVKRLGCRFGQGFLYSEAVPALEVNALLRRMARPRVEVLRAG